VLWRLGQAVRSKSNRGGLDSPAAAGLCMTAPETLAPHRYLLSARALTHPLGFSLLGVFRARQYAQLPECRA
jgi:hypothetical protein